MANYVCLHVILRLFSSMREVSVLVGECVSSAEVGYVHYRDCNSFQYLVILKQNMKQSADKLNIFCAFASTRTTIRSTLRNCSLLGIVLNYSKHRHRTPISTILNLFVRLVYKSSISTVEQLKQGIRRI